MKKYSLDKTSFDKLISTALTLRIIYCNEMSKSTNKETIDHYKREINEINEVFDQLNLKYKTDF